MDIRDESKLAQIESGITLLKTGLLEENPLSGDFDFAHYKQIHKFLFEDIFEWAGKIRDVNLSKKGTSFVGADDIERIAEPLFNRVKKVCLSSTLTFKGFTDEIAELYNDINLLHPFREGNGRTQRAFFSQLIRKCGYNINFGNVDADFLMISTIHAANGVMDYLKNFFHEAIEK
jgi:cell filamentation protein